MVVRSIAVLFVCVACNDPRTRSIEDAPPPGSEEPYVIPDAAPPPFDAGPPPTVACHPNSDPATQCELPPSRCLDASYLIYYTGGTCVDHKCEYETHWLYCYAGCWMNIDPVTGDGCSPGFT